MRALALPLVLCLAGCANLPAADEAAVESAGPVVPDGWSAADAAGAGTPAARADALTGWWQRFGDGRLVDLVRLALQANTSIQGAVAAVQQAQALRDVAASALGPALDASASAQRGTAGGRSTGNQFQLGLDARWALDLFGASRAAVAAGQASADASAASLGDVQVQIAAEVALNYLLLRSTEARTLIATEQLNSQLETLQITLWRQQAGLVTGLDVAQAQAAVAQSRAQLPVLQTAAAQTRHALAVLAGQPPAALAVWLATPRAGAAVPQVREGLVLSIPAQTLRQRADVRAAEYQVAAALARLGQAQAQRWPSFSIGGSLGLGAASVGALGGSAALASSLLASVALPVFDGGALRAQVRVQQAALAQARQAYTAAVLAALQQVEDALVALRGDQLRLASLQEAASAASDAALLARQRYSSGLIDFQTVLETQRTQYATQDGVASATANLGSEHVRLYKALGGGWLPTARPPNP